MDSILIDCIRNPKIKKNLKKMLNSSRKFLLRGTSNAGVSLAGSGSCNITSANPLMKSASLILGSALNRGSYLEVPKFSSVPGRCFFQKQKSC